MMLLGSHPSIRFLLLVSERAEYSHSSDQSLVPGSMKTREEGPDFLSELGLLFNFVQSNRVILHDGSMPLAANPPCLFSHKNIWSLKHLQRTLGII